MCENYNIHFGYPTSSTKIHDLDLSSSPAQLKLLHKVRWYTYNLQNSRIIASISWFSSFGRFLKSSAKDITCLVFFFPRIRSARRSLLHYDWFPKQRLRLRILFFIKAGGCVTEFRIRCPDFTLQILPLVDDCVTVFRIRCPILLHGFSAPTSVRVWFTLLGTPVTEKEQHPFWTPKREGGTGDAFGDMVALLSAAVMCFRAWSSVEILWPRVLLPLFAVTNRCHRAQPLINFAGAAKNKHDTLCATELFYLRQVRSCVASTVWHQSTCSRTKCVRVHVCRNQEWFISPRIKSNGRASVEDKLSRKCHLCPASTSTSKSSSSSPS